VPPGRAEAGRPRTGGYAIGLVLLAPFLAETVASGNTPAVLFPVVLPFFAVVYGCPALLLRELWVRGRLTAFRMLCAGIGYTAFNEGVVAATWFKLAPGTGRVLAFDAAEAGHVGGVNWAVAAGLVVFHTAFSLMLPVTLAQAVAVARGSGADLVPWVGRRTVAVCLVLIGVVLIGSLTPQDTARVCAGPAADTCAGGRGLSAVLVVAVAIGLCVPPRRRRPPEPSAPGVPGGIQPDPSSPPGQVAWPSSSHPAPPAPRSIARRWPVPTGAAFSLAFFGAFFGLPLAGLPGPAIAADVLLLAVVVRVAAYWVRIDDHPVDRTAVLLCLGALLPGMVASVAAWPVGQPVAALLAAVLLGWLLRRLPPPQPP
jgi:hypothetical protein